MPALYQDLVQAVDLILPVPLLVSFIIIPILQTSKEATQGFPAGEWGQFCPGGPLLFFSPSLLFSFFIMELFKCITCRGENIRNPVLPRLHWL